MQEGRCLERIWRRSKDWDDARHYTEGNSSVLFFNLDPRVGHISWTSALLSPFISALCFWLTFPRGVLSTYWCFPSRPCVVFLACLHLALFLELFLFPGNSTVSSWCDHSMLASLLWQCLTVPSLLYLRLGYLANPFHHRPFPYLSDWLHGLPDHFRLYFAQRLDLFT